MKNILITLLFPFFIFACASCATTSPQTQQTAEVKEEYPQIHGDHYHKSVDENGVIAERSALLLVESLEKQELVQTQIVCFSQRLNINKQCFLYILRYDDELLWENEQPTTIRFFLNRQQAYGELSPVYSQWNEEGFYTEIVAVMLRNEDLETFAGLSKIVIKIGSVIAEVSQLQEIVIHFVSDPAFVFPVPTKSI